MSESGFPWPWSGPQNRRLTLAVFAWLLLVNLWGLVAVHLLPISWQ